jgi:PepSY-associated TM region
MTRQFWVYIHRYVVLRIALFLVIVRLTGSFLAFYDEIDDWLNPYLLRVPVRASYMLVPLMLRIFLLGIVYLASGLNMLSSVSNQGVALSHR